MIVNIQPSERVNKRYCITMDNGKQYDFGYINGNTYIDHHNEKIKQQYIARHYGNETEKHLIDNLIPSPSLFSYTILWGPYTDIHKNINYLNNLWKNKHIKSGKGISEFSNEMLYDKYDYNQSSKQILNNYGNEIIHSMRLQRTPINKAINSFIKPFNDKNINKYYHLALIINDKIKIEKNERINITLDLRNNSNEIGFYRIFNIPNITINDLLENTLNKIGQDRFFVYNAFSQNCQNFILDILECNNINDMGARKFIYQDVSYIANNQKALVKTSKYLTDFAGHWNTLFN